MTAKRGLRRKCIFIFLAAIFGVNTFLFPFQQLSEFDFHSEWHPMSRSDRFPSVQDRVKIYMSNWYLPPCSNNASSDDANLVYRKEIGNNGWPRVHVSDSSNNDTITFDSIVDVDTPFYFTIIRFGNAPKSHHRFGHGDTRTLLESTSKRVYVHTAVK